MFAGVGTAVDGEFEEWARARGVSLLRAAFLLTGSQTAAEDLTQSTLEKVAVAWARIEEYPDAYARRVMYRLELSRWRRRRLAAESMRPTVEGAYADPSERVELRVVMERALRRITDACSVVNTSS